MKAFKSGGFSPSIQSSTIPTASTSNLRSTISSDDGNRSVPTCLCFPKIIEIISMIVSFISMACCAVAITAPVWSITELATSNLRTYSGLWIVCSDLYNAETYCYNYLVIPNWLLAIRLIMIAGSVLSFLSFISIFLTLWTAKKRWAQISSAISFFNAIASITALVLYVIYERQTANLYFGWTFFVGWTHVALCMTVSMMMAIDTCQMYQYRILA
ncbi:Claudin-18 [Trichoplax sp. H2]|nr:Claudin-18 [Trichoplax sp. H2]|eukprot:RDD40503.1 Claudin-18 [Trichoplax sp. H2]